MVLQCYLLGRLSITPQESYSSAYKDVWKRISVTSWNLFYLEYRSLCVALQKFLTAFLLYSFGTFQIQVWIWIFHLNVQRIFLSISRKKKRFTKTFYLSSCGQKHNHNYDLHVYIQPYNHIQMCWRARKHSHSKR